MNSTESGSWSAVCCFWDQWLWSHPPARLLFHTEGAWCAKAELVKRRHSGWRFQRQRCELCGFSQRSAVSPSRWCLTLWSVRKLRFSVSTSSAWLSHTPQILLVCLTSDLSHSNSAQCVMVHSTIFLFMESTLVHQCYTQSHNQRECKADVSHTVHTSVFQNDRGGSSLRWRLAHHLSLVHVKRLKPGLGPEKNKPLSSMPYLSFGSGSEQSLQKPDCFYSSPSALAYHHASWHWACAFLLFNFCMSNNSNRHRSHILQRSSQPRAHSFTAKQVLDIFNWLWLCTLSIKLCSHFLANT